MAWAKKDASSAEIKSIEASIKQVEEQMKQTIYQLGELFYEANKDVDILDEAYKDKLDTIKKLEYNCKVWNNRKLKTQGMRQCENCGNVLPYESSFCNKCGYKLKAVSEELVII